MSLTHVTGITSDPFLQLQARQTEKSTYFFPHGVTMEASSNVHTAPHLLPPVFLSLVQMFLLLPILGLVSCDRYFTEEVSLALVTLCHFSLPLLAALNSTRNTSPTLRGRVCVKCREDIPDRRSSRFYVHTVDQRTYFIKISEDFTFCKICCEAATFKRSVSEMIT